MERSATLPAGREVLVGLRSAGPLLIALMALLLVVWRDLAALPFTGEDYTLFSRLRDGTAAYPHVFRPLAGLWLASLHALFGTADPLPFHAASLALHAANTLLLYSAASALLGRRAPALLAALAFAVGAGACDALAWVAAANRPVSAFGALVAWNGLVRWRTSAQLAPTLLFAGLGWQLLANEEFYATAGLATLWLGFLSTRGVRSRATWIAAAGVVALAAIHFLFLKQVPDGAQGLTQGGLAAAPANALRRSALVVGGLGIPGLLGALLPLLLLALAAVRGRAEVAGFALLAWLTSFLPFVLDDAVPYRAYPTLAPTALCLACAAAAFANRERAAAGLLALAVLIGAHGPRSDRLETWRRATDEVRQVSELLRDAAPGYGAEGLALVNLDTSTAGAVLHHLGLDDPTQLTAIDFLDGVRAYVPAGQESPLPWIGRRVDGSFGVIDPDSYFSHRTALEELRLVGEAVEARDLEDARALLMSLDVDLVTAAVVETDAAALGTRTSAGEVVVIEPFVGDAVAVTGRMLVGVRAEGPTVLCVQSAWQYGHMMRFAADQALFSDVKRVRVLRMEAAVEGEETPRPGFHLNAFGFGVALPAGEHRIELRWRRATPEELRR